MIVIEYFKIGINQSIECDAQAFFNKGGGLMKQVRLSGGLWGFLPFSKTS